MDLVSLIEELERQKENSLDLIVDSGSLKAIPNEENGVKLAIPEYGELPLTDWAHGQLADKLGIPRRYYEKMRDVNKKSVMVYLDPKVVKEARELGLNIYF